MPPDRSFPIALYRGQSDTDATVVEGGTWEDLIDLLSEVRRTPCNSPCDFKQKATAAGRKKKDCPHKDGQAWSPVNFGPHPPERLNRNIHSLSVAVLEGDHVNEDNLRLIAEVLEGLRYIVYSTHSHAPPDDQALRIVLDLSRPVLAKEWRRFWKALVDRLGLPTDPACKDESRLYFLPTAPEGAEILFETGEGEPIDVDRILATAAQSPSSTSVDCEGAEPAAPAVVPTLPQEGVVDLTVLRDVLAARRLRYARQTSDEAKIRHALLDALLRGEPLAEPGNRDNSVHRLAGLVAWALPTDTLPAAVQEIFRPSITKMNCEPEGVQWWLRKAVTEWERANERRAEQDKIQKERQQAILDRLNAVRGRVRDIDIVIPELEENPEDPDAWKGLLMPKEYGGKVIEGAYASNDYNVAIILSYDPRVKGIRYNEVAKTIEAKGIFEGSTQATLDTAFNVWLQREYGINLGPSLIGNLLLYVAREDAYNPIAEYLRGITWDGTPRIDSLLQTYFRAVGDEGYLRGVSAKWPISAVARGLNPGAKVDTMIVLEGRQGARKTSALEVLAGEWYGCVDMNLRDKDTLLAVARAWIMELSELASLKKSEVEIMKGFFSRRSDLFRPPYGRVVEDHPRHCVFAGTTNEDIYLIDETGNRRFWPVKVGDVDLEALKRDRDQLWAEAVARYDAGEKWHFDDDEQKVADTVTEERTATSPSLAIVQDWWLSKLPQDRPLYIRTHDIAREAFGMTPDKITNSTLQSIGRALRKMNFKRERINKEWVYKATEDLRSAAQVRKNFLSVIKGGKDENKEEKT